MAPDRGDGARDETPLLSPNLEGPTRDSSHIDSSRGDGRPDESQPEDGEDDPLLQRTRADNASFNEMAHMSVTEGTNFTFRGVFVGTLIGVIICFSNTYFGLQTGWVSGMAMPASLIGFAVFKSVSRHLKLPFTPVENVLVQTVAGAVGMEPLGCGFIGVIPALQFLLRSEEGAPLELGLWKLIIWGVGISLFGVVFAVPLRKEFIIREKLKFPSGTATALMIGVLHGVQEKSDNDPSLQTERQETEQLLSAQGNSAANTEEGQGEDTRDEWKGRIRFLTIAFAVSAIYTLVQYFIPQLRNIPILGLSLANIWQWTFNPSPAYVGQGIIMGPATSLHMLIGAIIGWGILSPLAKKQGWAEGPVGDWETGSKGWIVWVSLAIMLADAVLNLGWLIIRPLVRYGPHWYQQAKETVRSSSWKDISSIRDRVPYTSLSTTSQPSTPRDTFGKHTKSYYDEFHDDAPPQHLISGRTVLILLVATIGLCILCVQVTFGQYIPVYLTIFAIVLSVPLSIMGVRALGETDLNPVSGISKLTQLVFALVTPASSPNGIIINLIAGAISEAGALQAGDMLQDIKAGHLLNASPKAQFYGQVIGSIIGSVISALVYNLYTRVYTIPSGMFQVPTAYVWIFTARLVTGEGLPPMAWQFAVGFGVLYVVLTAVRIYLASQPQGSKLRSLQAFIPGGIAVAVGMYNVPSFTLARSIGGLLSLYWTWWRGKSETPVIVLASGLILGEGVVSIVNLALESAHVPHL